MGFSRQEYWSGVPLPSWQIDWKTTETVRDYIFGSKITANDDCSHEVKRCLLLGRKVMTNLNSMLNSKSITLPTKVHLFKAMVYQVVMYGFESWTIKKVEHWRIDVFEVLRVPWLLRRVLRVPWLLRRVLRVPWTARRSNQSILKEISPEYLLEGLMLKLKLQYFHHLMQTTDLLEKTLMMGNLKAGIEGHVREWDGWMASPARWTWVWVSSRSWWWTVKPGVLQSMVSQRVGHYWVTELNWTEVDLIREPYSQHYK